MWTWSSAPAESSTAWSSASATTPKGLVFSLQERLAMMRREVGHLQNVQVKAFRGLMVDFAKAEKVSVVLRGIRTVSDLEYEIQMAFTNRSSAGSRRFSSRQAGARLHQRAVHQGDRPRRRARERHGLAHDGSQTAGAVGPRAGPAPARNGEPMSLRALLLGDVVATPAATSSPKNSPRFGRSGRWILHRQRRKGSGRARVDDRRQRDPRGALHRCPPPRDCRYTPATAATLSFLWRTTFITQ